MRKWDREQRLLLGGVGKAGNGGMWGTTDLGMRRCAGLRWGLGRDMAMVGSEVVVGVKGYATVGKHGGTVAKTKGKEQMPMLDSEQGSEVDVEDTDGQERKDEAGVRHVRDVGHEAGAQLDWKQLQLEEKRKTIEGCRRDIKGVKRNFSKEALNLIEGYYGEYMRNEICTPQLLVSVSHPMTRREWYQDGIWGEEGEWRLFYGFDTKDPKNKELLEEGELEKGLRD